MRDLSKQYLPYVASLVRYLLVIIGTKRALTDNEIEAIAGIVLVIVSIVWSLIERRKRK